MSATEEVRRLQAIEREVRTLLETGDPLLRSQYAHLLGRVTALLTVAGVEDPGAPTTG